RVGLINRIAQDVEDLDPILVGQRREHLLNRAGGAVRHQGMAMGQVLIRRATAGSGLSGLQEPVVSTDDLIGESHFSLRRLAQVEMRSAALFNTDVENGLAVIQNT